MDGVSLTKPMSPDEVVRAIRKDLEREMRVLAFDEPETARKWPGCGRDQKLQVEE